MQNAGFTFGLKAHQGFTHAPTLTPSGHSGSTCCNEGELSDNAQAS